MDGLPLIPSFSWKRGGFPNRAPTIPLTADDPSPMRRVSASGCLRSNFYFYEYLYLNIYYLAKELAHLHSYHCTYLLIVFQPRPLSTTSFQDES